MTTKDPLPSTQLENPKQFADNLVYLSDLSKRFADKVDRTKAPLKQLWVKMEKHVNDLFNDLADHNNNIVNSNDIKNQLYKKVGNDHEIQLDEDTIQQIKSDIDRLVNKNDGGKRKSRRNKKTKPGKTNKKRRKKTNRRIHLR